jgi:hypothetical protein
MNYSSTKNYSFKDLGNPRMEYRENYYLTQSNIYKTSSNISPNNTIYPKNPYISQVKDGYITEPQTWSNSSPSCSY